VLNRASTIVSEAAVPAGTFVTAPELERLKADGAKRESHEGAEYLVYRVSDRKDLAAGKYWVDPATGRVRFLVDPGINGALTARDDGTKVQKYEAPKARLMSLIIDGILTQKLPWGLVLLGAAIALVLELCGISALPFAVGVYLPLAASTPIFVGGMARAYADRRSGKRKGGDKDDGGDASPGVLYSSGLIAGGSIAGIGLALLALAPAVGTAIDFSGRVPAWMGSSGFALLPFGLLVASLIRRR